MKTHHTTIAHLIACLFIFAVNGNAQTFSSEKVITTMAEGAKSVQATDLDGDGKLDVLTASEDDNKVAWHRNLGGGEFGPQQIITTDMDEASCAIGADLDGDGDVDVAWSSNDDNIINYHLNNGVGNFSGPHLVSGANDEPKWLSASDLNGDSRVDIVSASDDDNTIAWHENLGGSPPVFTMHVLDQNSMGARHVSVSDLGQGNGGDILAVSKDDNTVAWFENLGNGGFSTRQTIEVSACPLNAGCSADLNADGFNDVIAVGCSLTWYENLQNGQFGPAQVISSFTDGAEGSSVCAADINQDGEMDLLVAEAFSWSENDKITYYRNDGDGEDWTTETLLAGEWRNPYCLFVADLDQDGNLDVLSTVRDDDAVLWFENNSLDDCNDNGVDDAEDIALGIESDCDNDGYPDSCEADTNANGVPDDCESSGGGGSSSGGGCGVMPVSGPPTGKEWLEHYAALLMLTLFVAGRSLSTKRATPTTV